MSTTRDFPVLDGRPVTQAHSNTCAARGHAAHTVGGIPTGACPRCGASTTYSGATPSVILSAAPEDPYGAACIRRCTCGHHSSAHTNFSGTCRAWQSCNCPQFTHL